MFYSTWLLAAEVAGWATGKITGNDGFGTGADVLLGITGALLVRWSLENMNPPVAKSICFCSRSGERQHCRPL